MLNFFENDPVLSCFAYICSTETDESIFRSMSSKIVEIEKTKLSELQNMFSNVLFAIIMMMCSSL